MAASLEERSSGCCLCNFRALPLFDFGDGTDDISKSSSELESESSGCDFRFLCDERVSIVRTGAHLSCGVLCEEDPSARAGFSDSSSVSSGEDISEFDGEFSGFVCSSFLVVAGDCSDIGRRRSPDFCVFVFRV